MLARRLTSAGLNRTKTLYAVLGLHLTLSLVAAAGALLVFAALASEVLEGETRQFDEAVLSWLRSHHTTWLDRIALELTALGSGVVLLSTGVLVSVLLWHVRQRSYVALIWIAAVGAQILNHAMKVAFGRPRPPIDRLVEVGPLSFPSGHAMNAIVFYTVIAFVIGRVVGAGAGRTMVYALGGVVTVVVGWTRMYLGVHYPSDVIAGFAVGYAWAIACAVVLQYWFGASTSTTLREPGTTPRL